MQEISWQEIRDRIRDPSLLLVDVLPAEAFAESHIPGSLSLPVAQVDSRARSLLPEPEREIVVYCAGPACDAAERALRALHAQGYANLRHYRGGMEDWVAHGSAVEASAPRGAAPLPRAAARRLASGFWQRAFDLLASLSIGRLLATWSSMIASMGVAYWLVQIATGEGLVMQNGAPLPGTLASLGGCMYFSFVTALSVGYGDIVPVGFVRALAIAEGALGLLLFGCVVSKLVSGRQEQLTLEIHRISFEGRMGRVQTNLHLVLSDLQGLSLDWGQRPIEPARVIPRLESLAGLFVAELHTVHDLLYRPQQAPEEDVLETILGSLAAGLQELRFLTERVPGESRPPSLQATLRSLRMLSNDICSDCVPSSHAASLKTRMDRVQELSRAIA